MLVPATLAEANAFVGRGLAVLQVSRLDRGFNYIKERKMAEVTRAEFDKLDKEFHELVAEYRNDVPALRARVTTLESKDPSTDPDAPLVITSVEPAVYITNGTKILYIYGRGFDKSCETFVINTKFESKWISSTRVDMYAPNIKATGELLVSVRQSGKVSNPFPILSK